MKPDGFSVYVHIFRKWNRLKLEFGKTSSLKSELLVSRSTRCPRVLDKEYGFYEHIVNQNRAPIRVWQDETLLYS